MEKMMVCDIANEKKVDNLQVMLTKVEEPKQFENFRGKGRLQKGTLTDESGEIGIVFWENDIGTFKEGDNLLLKDCWCKSFREELQVSRGKFGTITKVEVE